MGSYFAQIRHRETYGCWKISSRASISKIFFGPSVSRIKERPRSERVSGGGRWYLRGPNDLNREQTARGAHIERITRGKKGGRASEEDGRGWRAREKGGNGARYGEMARKLRIVTGNGRLL